MNLRRRLIERASVSIRWVVVLTFGIWLMLRQVDGVLARLQTDTSGSYGANDFWQPSPVGLVNHVRDLVLVWNKDAAVSGPAYWTYTGLDVVFIVAYVVLLNRLFKRLAAPSIWSDRPMPLGRIARKPHLAVAALAAADGVEDLVRLVLAHQASPNSLLIWLAWGVTWLKWFLLGCIVLLLVRALHMRARTEPGRPVVAALGRLRVPLVLLTVWGLFVLFDPTGQTADIFRRWLNDPWQFLVSTFCSAAGAAVLGYATWTTARRSVLAGFKVNDEQRGWPTWLAIGVFIFLLGLATGWHNLWGISAVIAAVLVLSLVASLLDDRVSDDTTAADDNRAKSLLKRRAAAPAGADEIRRIARGLATWPLVALLLGASASWTAPPIILFSVGPDHARAAAATVLAPLFLAFAVAVAYFVPRVLRHWEPDEQLEPGRLDEHVLRIPWPDRLEYRHVAVAGVCGVVAALSICEPFGVPTTIGALAVTAVAAAIVIIGLGEAQRYGDTHEPPLGLRVLGFASFPLTLLLVAAYGAGSLIDSDGSFHAVHRSAATAPDAAGIDLETAFQNWVSHSCAAAADPSTDVPMVFIASHGGGIRAAYWTAGALTDLLAGGKKKFAGNCSARPIDRVFAMGGASGGSVGVTSFLGHAGDPAAWYRKTLGDPDYASVPVSWGLLVDAPRALIGFDAPDRARRFEQSLERHDRKLEGDFFKGQGESEPLLLLASTQVESGCRLNVSAIRLTSPKENGRCAALESRSAVTKLSNGVLAPDAPMTAEVLDYLCEKGSLERASAALASARFPYVSPSGQFRCGKRQFTAVVDGGYAENTGAQAVLNLWYRVEPLVAAHNRSGQGGRIVPIFVNIDNHYSKAAKTGPPARTQELLVPPLTAGRPDKLDNIGVEQLAEAEFSRGLPGKPTETCRIGGNEKGDPIGPTERYVRIAPTKSPGIPAPLAWTLSRMAQNDLDRQRQAVLKTPWGRTVQTILNTGRLKCPG